MTSPESPSSLLERAADLIENLACGASAPPWRVEQRLFGPTDEPILRGPDIFDANPADAAWIATLNPSVATPLVAWLRAESRFVRRNIKHMHGDVEHLPSMRFARQILGQETT